MEKIQDAFKEEILKGKGMLCVLDHSGDTKLIWDRCNKDEVETAEETFNRLTKKGFAAFSVNKEGDTDKKVTKFDPKLEKIILVPPIAGG